MIVPKTPPNEAARLQALLDYDILDTDPEEAFDDLTRIASRSCSTPIALVSLIDSHRQWFKSAVGLDATETPRDVSFCGHAILESERVLVIPDAEVDPRFSDNPLVTDDPRVRSYAGAPLVNQDGLVLGTLCVIDHKPRELSQFQIETLKLLARQVVVQLELRKRCFELKDLNARLDLANSTLSHRNDEIRTFYQTLAHELKTPLTASRELVSIIRDGLMGPVTEEQKQNLGSAVDCCDQINVHINDLLDLTRLETGKLAMERRPASLQDVVSRALNALEGAARKSALTLEHSIQPGMPQVNADPVRMTQVITNLVNNAIKFTPPGGRVSVSVRPSQHAPDRILVEISDTGVGMSEEHLDRIFDRLYQVDREDGQGRGGLGIGLCLCREIVALHEGELMVTSTPGEGSTFSFDIPAISEIPNQTRAA